MEVFVQDVASVEHDLSYVNGVPSSMQKPGVVAFSWAGRQKGQLFSLSDHGIVSHASMP